jgi:hypothetical protein
MRLVTAARAGSRVSGSKYAMYCGQRDSAESLPSRVATASATKIRSNLPRSAVCVISA